MQIELQIVYLEEHATPSTYVMPDVISVEVQFGVDIPPKLIQVKRAAASSSSSYAQQRRRPRQPASERRRSCWLLLASVVVAAAAAAAPALVPAMRRG